MQISVSSKTSVANKERPGRNKGQLVHMYKVNNLLIEEFDWKRLRISENLVACGLFPKGTSLPTATNRPHIPSSSKKCKDVTRISSGLRAPLSILGSRSKSKTPENTPPISNKRKEKIDISKRRKVSFDGIPQSSPPPQMPTETPCQPNPLNK
ncbi:hypothetical protein PanWU01x14_049700 [Parasponia andersonii]|uniref:Uncharacterized protein n=1 Tax=Parasponia andersonii TaxID=3476 RepID=A0A2P5DMQ0_PARAD|nr:hypothetical protein PanWU01x14_049700 [Parasponia andersonii]